MTRQVKRYEGFKGINTASSPNALPNGDLIDAVGVISDRRGRLVSCWEGRTIPYVGGKSLDAEVFQDAPVFDRPPDRLYYWDGADKMLISNEFNATFNAEGNTLSTRSLKQNLASTNGYDSTATYNLGDTVFPSTWVASTAYSTGDIRVPETSGSECTGLMYKVTSAGTSGSSEPDWPIRIGQTVTDNGVTWEAIEGKYYVLVNYAAAAAAGAEPTWPTSIGATVQGPANAYTWRCEGKWATATWAVEFNDYLVVANEDQPIFAIHKETAATTTPVNVSGDTGSHINFRTIFEIGYRPLYAYHKYYKKGSVTLSDSSGVMVASEQENADWYDQPDSPGYGASGDFHSMGHLFQSNQDYSYDSLYPKGYAFNFDRSDGNADLTNTNHSASDEFDRQSGTSYRVGYLGQIVKMRHPVVWQGRLVAVEGRQYEYGPLNMGLGVTVDRVGVATLDIKGHHATGEVAVGDEIIVYYDHVEAADSNVKDYELSTVNATVAEITDGVLSGDDTRLTVSYGDAATNLYDFGTGRDFHIRRKLKPYERRRIWVAGRPEDPNAGIDEDPRDFLTWSEHNSFYVGSDDDGNITCLHVIDDTTLLVGMEKAIYLVQWQLQESQVSIPMVNKIFDRGIKDDRCIAQGQAGVYFFCESDKRLYMYTPGAPPQPVDVKIRNHYGLYELQDGTSTQFGLKTFTHLAYCDNRLYAQTLDRTPYIYIFDELTQGWTVTQRQNCGTNQIGASANVPGSAAYISAHGSNTLEATGMNTLFDAKKPGGVFTPFCCTDKYDDQIIVFNTVSGDYFGHSMNYKPDINNWASLRHGARIVFPMESQGLIQTQPRQVRFVNSLVMIDGLGGGAFSTRPIGFTSDDYQELASDSTFGYTQETANDAAIAAEYTESSSLWESYRYNVPSHQIRQWSRALQIGDRACPIGEISQVEYHYMVKPWRQRVA